MGRGYLVFGDLEGKLDTLRVECTNCPRQGRYHVAKLIERHGRQGNLMKWREMLNADCPKRDGRLNDRCDMVCPDLPKVSETDHGEVEATLLIRRCGIQAANNSRHGS